MMSHPTEGLDLYERLAESLCEAPEVARSTMMGFPCLRVDEKFFASVEPKSGHLIVKLSANRVDELVSSGAGIPFAPNGRTFREWVALPVPDDDEWRALLLEAWTFVGG